MSTSEVCIICKKGASPSNRLVNNPEMMENLLKCCVERLSLGQSDVRDITDRLMSMSEAERRSAFYHSECRKPIVNRGMIDRLKANKQNRSPCINADNRHFAA